MNTTNMPIDNPCERARLVVKELRSRSVWARVSQHDNAAISLVAIGMCGPCERQIVLDVARYLPARAGYPDSTPLVAFDKLSAKAIADAIQADDLKRLQEWAGDDGTTTYVVARHCSAEVAGEARVAVGRGGRDERD